MVNNFLGLKLSKFGRLLILRPGKNDNPELVRKVENDLWLRRLDYERIAERIMVQWNATSTEEHLRALALRTNLHSRPWLYLFTLIARTYGI